MRIRLAALLSLLFLLTAPGVSAQQQTRLVGRVTDAATGVGVSEALVRVEGTGRSATTDEDGAYVLADLPSGSYQVTVSRLGFGSVQVEVDLVAGQTARRDFALQVSALSLEALVVSAQGRRQALQEVPIAVTAYDGDFLDRLGVREFDSFSAFVPGLEVQIQSVNNPGFVIRGITSDSGDSRIEPRVSVFQDGISISKSRGSVVELFDMDRIEVLKGPQGTLFGRGASIGAVHLIQNKPQPFFDGRVTAGAGNFDERYIDGFLNFPIAEDKLFARVAGIVTRREGFIENISGGNLNGKDVAAIRASLRWVPNDRSTIDLIVNAQDDNPPGTSFKSGSFAPAGGSVNPNTFADMERGDDLFIDRTVWGATLLGDFEIGRNLTLRSLTGYRSFDSFESFDADGTVAPVLWFGEDAQGDQFSQELRLNFEGDGAFNGFVGASYFWEDGSQGVPFETDERSFFALLTPILAGAGQPVPVLPLVNPDGTPNLAATINPFTGQPFKTFHSEEFTNFGTARAFEVFADGTYSVTDRLDLTAGIRGTFEDVEAAYEVRNSETPGGLGAVLGATPNNLFAPTNGRITGEDTFQSWVGRLTAAYEASDAVNLFANVARGRRPNVINVTAGGVNVLNDEIVLSYEAGTKTSFDDGRFEFDANAFYYDYTNFQTSVTELTDQGIVTETRDEGSASATGFETALRFAPSSSVSLFANYGWIDASFDDVDEQGTPQALAGNTFRLTPEHSLSLGGGFFFEAGPLGSIFVRPTYTWKSRVFFEELNQPGVEQEAYGLFNVRAGIDLPGDRFGLEVWANNILDEEFVIDGGNTGGAFGIPTFIAGPPRLFGLRLTARSF
jgi:outer membrane receptor protein involved in Fe transport